MAGKAIYSHERKEKTTHEDSGQARMTIEGGNGKFPSCLPQEWKEGFPKDFIGNSIELECSCGRHTLHAVRMPKTVWPGNSLERIRAIEN